MLAGTGITVTQQALGTGGMIALATGAAAASATGIGLIVAGGVVYTGQLAISAKAAHKSRMHARVLSQIAAKSQNYQCVPLMGTKKDFDEHEVLRNEVLPYILSQKSKKFGRRVAGAIPVSSEFEMFRAGFRKLYKKAKGTAGQDRWKASAWLTRHLFTHNCGLVQAIVSELLSFSEMIELQTLQFDEAVKILEHKVKSV